MKNIKFIARAVATVGILALGSQAQALPSLQLDIQGGTYVGGTDQTTYANGQSFDLYTLLNKPTATELGYTYYVSIAVYPAQAQNPVPSIGSFSINGTTYTSANMVWGVPPVDQAVADLPTHSVFPTYYLELGFTFSPTDRLNGYDVQTDPLDPASQINASGDTYFHKFEVNLQGLLAGYSLHFDLYRPVDGNTIEKAPFSHDAQSGPGTGHDDRVPDGGTTVALLGFAFAGLGAARRFMKR